MDTIACESCGARLLFSTPSSWNQQQGIYRIHDVLKECGQLGSGFLSLFLFLLKMSFFLFFFPVEKAALVFSLKLDSGHKLLCPWIDNACDEALADFPPTPPPILVNKFRERCSMLLHLSALPITLSSFPKWMKSPHLKQFLEELSLKEFGYESFNQSEIDLGDGQDSDTAKVYYQVLLLLHQYLHMLISVVFTNLLGLFIISFLYFQPMSIFLSLAFYFSKL